MATQERTIEGLDEVLKKLQELPAEIVSKKGGVVLGALRKGGRVVQKQMKQNLRSMDIGDTGTLEKSIRSTRLKHPKAFDGADEAIVVGPKGKKGQYPETTAQTPNIAYWIENGTKRMPARPFAMAAYSQCKEQALSEVIEGLKEGVAKAIKKYEKR